MTTTIMKRRDIYNTFMCNNYFREFKIKYICQNVYAYKDTYNGERKLMLLNVILTHMIVNKPTK